MSSSDEDFAVCANVARLQERASAARLQVPVAKPKPKPKPTAREKELLVKLHCSEMRSAKMGKKCKTTVEKVVAACASTVDQSVKVRRRKGAPPALTPATSTDRNAKQMLGKL